AGSRVRLVELVQGAADCLGLARAESLSSGLERGLQSRLGIRWQPVRPLLAVLLDPVHQAVELVASLDLLPARLVLLGMLLGGLDHSIDLALAQAARGFDPDFLLLARGLVFGRYVQN